MLDLRNSNSFEPPKFACGNVPVPIPGTLYKSLEKHSRNDTAMKKSRKENLMFLESPTSQKASGIFNSFPPSSQFKETVATHKRDYSILNSEGFQHHSASHFMLYLKD